MKSTRRYVSLNIKKEKNVGEKNERAEHARIKTLLKDISIIEPTKLKAMVRVCILPASFLY